MESDHDEQTLDDAGTKNVAPDIKRGVTAMKKVSKTRSLGEKIVVGWNDKGQPIDPNKATFVGYLGFLARTMVPINISNWRRVTGVKKRIIWEDVKSAFEVDESRRRFSMAEVGKLARSFRSYLTRAWLYDEDGKINDKPPAQYEIPQDVWDEFVKMRLTDAFQVRSATNQERAKEPEYPWRKSRLGFPVITQKQEERKKESGSDLTEVTRYSVWLEGHTNSKGEIDNPNVKKVAEKIAMLTKELEAKGEKDGGRNDILATALEKTDDGSRVIGGGFGVTPSEYCKDAKPTKAQYEQEVRSLKSSMRTLEEQIHSLQTKFEELKSGAPVAHGEEVVSLKDSCPGSVRKLPEVKGPCELELSSPKRRVVAQGLMLNRPSDRTLHTRPLPSNQVKVIVKTIKEGEEDTPLPFPNENADVHVIKDAIGTIVAWPTILVIADQEQSKDTTSKSIGLKRTRTTKESDIQSKAPVKKPLRKSDKYEELVVDTLPFQLCCLGKTMKKMSLGDLIYIDCEEPIMNMAFEEKIGKEEIYELLRQEKIGASHLCVYIKLLWIHSIVGGGKTNRFSFLCPHVISALSNNDIERKAAQPQIIADCFISKAEKDKLFLAPYNAGDHWVLLVINPLEGTVFYLDSVHGDPDNRLDMIETFNQAVMIFRANNPHQLPKAKSGSIKWIPIKCPRQNNSTDCGYYVMRFMKEIVNHRETTIPETYFPDCRCLFYSQEQIDEVRFEWAEYVVRCS